MRLILLSMSRKENRVDSVVAAVPNVAIVVLLIKNDLISLVAKFVTIRRTSGATIKYDM